ncbi:MAG: tetratricopeptide repeat protein [Thaumarchaeota archaeon]|nr:MAG: tetratricopeptide repeat protein [Nitrososphaerota archaeon]TLX94626.1 MAG: tetratricopeptide repeat protein [Nitrososphaerota archaeon]
MVEKNTEKLPIDEMNRLYYKGIFLFCTGKYEESIQCFDRIISINPASTIAFGYKGLALLKLKRHREAVKCYERGLVC